ncbi:geranylgeranyl diphosphate synthase, type II [Zhouia amylolytica]|uniref:Geranylgeranyl diphosphate synthase, type II n=1 Tax=Zhouia amylolytica TaxID=376730 RepID=A0A1I6SQV9_9FLAO|nr:polyprenyl synthetase family protein [Zhouia amylolytica]MCQ0110256.1 polyprenyl synthetase family protein [Zhouia amylolytica]SFS79279.1 geranylgeranyl diphosphate synthase, type II [Zhouia amylolytica]
MSSIATYREAFCAYLDQKVAVKEPKNLYEPMVYILNLGGKRLRPVLTLMTTEVFGEDYTKALDAALAIEIFHNFSLVHDDIMDDAPLRRGKKTVHEKWDLNTGILSGDVMLIVAYRFFENYPPEKFRDLAKLFSKTAIEVCEGQQYDIDFETRNDVSESEYLKMITYKTAVLVGAAMKMGAIVAGTTEEQAQAIYDFGLNLGIAFQLKDDYLDAFGDPETFGKQVGGDIIENKKTYLYIKTIENLDDDRAEALKTLFNTTPEDPAEKIDSVKALMHNSGAVKLTEEAIEKYTKKAFEVLNTLDIPVHKKAVLQEFGEQLMGRTV